MALRKLLQIFLNRKHFRMIIPVLEPDENFPCCQGGIQGSKAWDIVLHCRTPDPETISIGHLSFCQGINNKANFSGIY